MTNKAISIFNQLRPLSIGYDDVFDHLRDAGFSNLILPGTGFECFKMRHGSGDQKDKFGQIMFDTIDKIAIKFSFTYLGKTGT